MFDADGGKKMHKYPTRYKKTPNIQKHHSTTFNKSFICQAIKQYNNIPGNLKQEQSLQRFITQFKKYLLS